jgi:hypothetical protein
MKPHIKLARILFYGRPQLVWVCGCKDEYFVICGSTPQEAYKSYMDVKSNPLKNGKPNLRNLNWFSPATGSYH